MTPALTEVLLVGSGDYGQTEVDDAPGYRCVPVRRRQRGVIALARVDGSLRQIAFTPLPFHPGWLSYNVANGLIYASGDDDRLYALALRDDHTVEVVGSADSLGGSAFIELSRDGKWALVANYGSGVLGVLPLQKDGPIGAATDSKQPWPLDGLDPALDDRQESCHPHQVMLDPSGRWALACDLGADRVWVYAFDGSRGALFGAVTSAHHLVLPAGSGPRHLAFHPSGKLVFVLCELDGEVVTCGWDAQAGELTVRSSVGMMADGVACSRAHHSGCSHIAVAPSGGVVYAAERTSNTIVVFACDKGTGKLRPKQRVSTGGVCPRHFVLDATSLIVVNQDTSTIVELRVKPDGSLDETPAAVCEVTGVCPWVICRPGA